MASAYRMCLVAIGLASLLGLAAPGARADEVPNSRAMDRVLGWLAAADEAQLREALQAMEDAEAVIRSGRDEIGRRRFAEAGAWFAARAASLALPDGTRAALRAGLAEYSRQALRAPHPPDRAPRVESVATLTGR